VLQSGFTLVSTAFLAAGVMFSAREALRH